NRIDDPPDGLSRVRRVERPEDKVARLRRRERERDGLPVAELRDRYDIGVLPQRRPERARERRGVRPHLPLRDDGLTTPVDVFDGVLDGEDVLGARADDAAQGRGDRRALAAAGWTRAEDESRPKIHEPGERRREPELLQRRRIRRQDAEHDVRTAVLPVSVRPKPSYLR